MIRAFSIPDSHDARLAWLERELVGPDLPKLATELAAVHGEGGLDQTLVDDRRVLEDGLRWLGDAQLEQLLCQPQTLIALQRRVLSADTDYWQAIAPPREASGRSMAETLDDLIRETPPVSATPSLQRGSTAAGSRRTLAWSAAAALATAAGLVLTVDPWRPAPQQLGQATPDPAPEVQNPQPAPADPAPIDPPTPAEPVVVRADQAWGFGKFVAGVKDDQEKLGPPLTREAYLSQLADAAEAWRNKRPGNRAELAQRLGEFRMGCSALLLAEHSALPETDRQWLRDRCRSWAAAIDRRLTEVESGADPESVLLATDSTIGSIAESLRGRSESPPA
ncbi:MAG: hypothetical protein AAGJ46_18455 [Planctomycetota bacterium]